MLEKTYVVGSDSASRAAWDKLDLHVDFAEEVLVLGLEARARGPVKGEGKKFAIVEYLSPIIPTPSDVKVLVQVGRSKRGDYYEQKRDKRRDL